MSVQINERVFSDAIGSWSGSGIDTYLANCRIPALFHQRVKRQLVMCHAGLLVADRMGTRPVVIGSGTAHMREHRPWPGDRTMDIGSLPEAYGFSREANDLDLYFPGFDSASEYRDRAAWALRDIGGQQLGGLVEYTIDDLETDPTGHAVANITARPAAPAGRLAPVTEPISFEIDLKSPKSQSRVEHDPRYGGFREAAHPYLPVDFPGFPPARFKMLPSELMLGDMLILATGPESHQNNGLDGHWWRPKDQFVIHQMISTGKADGDLLLYAMEHNHNLPPGTRINPAQYTVRGRGDEPLDVGRGARPGLELWTEGVEAIRARQPNLAGHPSATQMIDQSTDFVRGLDAAGPGAQWEAGAWRRRDDVSVRPSESFTRAAAATAPGHVERPSAPPGSGSRPYVARPASPGAGRPGRG